ncbi:MAG: hypothetical protein ABSC56_04610 [Solirubrobacteraceae bacterium]|jgi:hypothetical protein
MVLADLLARSGLRRCVAPPVPGLSSLPTNFTALALETYAALGGVLACPKLRPGAWDLAFDGGLVVELDEELHFNRYRLLTLDAPWYESRAWAAHYRALCVQHESECLAAGRWGRRWSNDSCAAMFGAAGTPGELGGAGAPRWKQRALYDAMKDLVAVSVSAIGPRVARLSVYDRVDGVPLGAALELHGTVDVRALAELVDDRARS